MLMIHMKRVSIGLVLILACGQLLGASFIQDSSELTELRQYARNFCVDTGGKIKPAQESYAHVCCYHHRCLHINLRERVSTVIPAIKSMEVADSN